MRLTLPLCPDDGMADNPITPRPYTVISPDDRARRLAEELAPYREAQARTALRRTAILLLARDNRLLLSFGSAPSESMWLDMRTDADGLLLAYGWRRVSGWEMVSGFETCDIERDR
jgi:hypothetical protein